MRSRTIGIVLEIVMLCAYSKSKSDSPYGTKVEMTAENCTQYAGGTRNRG